MRKSTSRQIKATIFCCLFILTASAQKISFTVSMDNPASHIFHVSMQYSGFKGDAQDFKMPVWTPGYYQRLDFANNLDSLTITDAKGKSLTWEKVNINTWRVQTGGATS